MLQQWSQIKVTHMLQQWSQIKVTHHYAPHCAAPRWLTWGDNLLAEKQQNQNVSTLTTNWFNVILTYHCKVTMTVPRGRLCSQTVGRRHAAEDRPSHRCVTGGWSGAVCAAAHRTGRCQRQGKDGWSASPATCCCAGCGSGPTGSPGTGDIQVSLQVFRSQYKNGPAVCVCACTC